MKPLYESLLDSKEKRSEKILNELLLPIYKYLGYTKDNANIELKDGKVFVTKNKRNEPAKVSLHFKEDKLNWFDVMCDASLLKYCYFDHCTIRIHSDSNKCDLSFLNNCKSCKFTYEGDLDKDIIQQFSKYMKPVKGSTLCFRNWIKNTSASNNLSILNNMDFGDNNVIFDFAVIIQNVRGLKAKEMGFVDTVVYKLGQEEANKINRGLTSIHLEDIHDVNPEVLNYIADQFQNDNPGIKYLYIAPGINQSKIAKKYIYKDKDTGKFTYKFVKDGDNPPRFN